MNYQLECERLRKGIADFLSGDYPNPRQSRPLPCKHGTEYWQECPQCDAEYLSGLIA